MSHRYNDGRPKCSNCRYWSEMVAHVEGGEMSALCIVPNPFRRIDARTLQWKVVESQNPMGKPIYSGMYTGSHDYCPHWEDGSLGAIDQPGGNPYETEQGEEKPCSESNQS